MPIKSTCSRKEKKEKTRLNSCMSKKFPSIKPADRVERGDGTPSKGPKDR
jgi:hypothetical protein